MLRAPWLLRRPGLYSLRHLHLCLLCLVQCGLVLSVPSCCSGAGDAQGPARGQPYRRRRARAPVPAPGRPPMPGRAGRGDDEGSSRLRPGCPRVARAGELDSRHWGEPRQEALGNSSRPERRPSGWGVAHCPAEERAPDCTLQLLRLVRPRGRHLHRWRRPAVSPRLGGRHPRREGPSSATLVRCAVRGWLMRLFRSPFTAEGNER